MPRILIVEENVPALTRLVEVLTASAHSVVAASTGLQGLVEVALQASLDVVIVSSSLPDVATVTWVKIVRMASSVPIIVAVTTETVETPVAVLDAGADTYVSKQVDDEELLARLRALLRRCYEGPIRHGIQVGELFVDESTRAATLNGRDLGLSRREFDLLLALARCPGEVVSKATLMHLVWCGTGITSPRTIDVHLTWLRHKLGETAAEPRYLQTVYGVGVRLVDPSA